MHYASFLLVLAGIAVSGASSAQITAHPCDHCTDIQFEQKAIQLHVGKHYLYDFYESDIRRYEVKREPLDALQMPTTWTLTVREMAVPVKVRNTFNAVNEFWAMNHHSLEVNVDVPFDPGAAGVPPELAGISAFDVALYPADQRNLGEWVLNEQLDNLGVPDFMKPTVIKLNAIVQSMAESTYAKMIFGTNIAQGTFLVHFPDGSVVYLSLDFTHFSEPYFAMAIDSQGNIIPTNWRDLSGAHYRFMNPYSFDAFGEHVRSWNVGWPGSWCISTRLACTTTTYPTGLSSGDSASISGEAGDLGGGTTQLYRVTVCECVD